MTSLIKTPLTYLFLPSRHIKFLSSFKNGNRDGFNFCIPQVLMLFLAVHLRLSTPFVNTRMVDYYAFETPSISSIKMTNLTVVNIFSIPTSPTLLTILTPQLESLPQLPSMSSLFMTSNWLERELGEMHGLLFTDKEDSRNLMLPYGDASSPLQKVLPSIGLREIFFDATTDLVASRPLSIQF